jgi:cell division protein ZapA (FtsZ GTPase activity inhibitor)
MDPASAIGVASAAIAFLDFSIDACKTFSQTVTSEEGITKHNADVTATVKRYKELSEALKAKGASATSLQLGPDISIAVEETIAVSMELLALVEQLRHAKQTPVIEPLKAVYRSMRSRERIESLQQKAERCQSEITRGLLQATSETSTLNHESSDKAFQHLDKQDTNILAALKAGNSELLKQVIESRRHFDTTVSDLQDSLKTGNDHITQKIDSFAQSVLDMTKPDLRKAFVDSLFFPDYERREKALSGPSPMTFEWIFNRDGVADSASWDPARWPSFPQWLESADSSQQYWLSGKAGSGKSTLMAHIIRTDMALDRTRDHLNKWHGDKPLHILKFFLFRPGREQQAGLESLLRSLLFQLVTSIPIMQEILMANFLPPDCGARIPT